MTQYLLSIYQPDGEPPPPEQLQKVMQDMHAFITDAQAQGAWVFNGGLFPPSSATVVRHRAGEALLTDGPFTEGKEHLGGFIIIRAADVDGALAWAARLAQVVTLPGDAAGLPIEVRPLAHSSAS
jgi:hypothetical protein